MQNSLIIPSLQFPVVEIFESLQGEGANTGMPSIFIRFGRCNLRCSWCDTPYQQYRFMSFAEILERVAQFSARNIIITGGEPTIVPNLAHLLAHLKAQGFFLAIETNGLENVPEEIDYIATSPKFQFAKMYEKQGIKKANEVRIVVDKLKNPADFLAFCQTIRQRIQADFYFLSPCQINGEFNLLQTLQLLGDLNAKPQKKPWLLSLQTHLLVGIE